MVGLTKSVLFILVLVTQFGCSKQTCDECVCCKGRNSCDSNKNCIDGCIDDYYGYKCTEKCLENCKTCVNGYECIECKPGYYTNKCNLQCGKGCINNTCNLISGECTCKPSLFIGSKCDSCVGLKYGEECNNTCPSNCGTCASETECSWCKNNVYYGSYCQYRCSVGCDDGRCNNVNGTCTKGCKANFSGMKCDECSPGLYGLNCDLNRTENCLSASNCTVCRSGFYGQNCTNTCPSGCNENCSFADGKCFDCRPGFVGEFCDTCEDGTYGVNCSQMCHNVDKNCQLCIANESGTFKNCTRCSSGYYPITAFWQSHNICINCSNDCKDTVCDKTGFCTNGCLHSKWGDRCNVDCKRNCVECDQNDGTCLEPFKGAESDENKSLVIIASSSGAGVAVIVLLVILVIYLIKRNRRQKLSSNTKCEENEYVLDMKEIPKQINNDEPGVIYAKPFKPKQEAVGDAGKEYDTAYDGDQKIPAIDNGYTAVNIETSANEKNKSFEVCDNEHDNKCNKPLGVNNDYAVVNKGKSTVKENECFEEVYDTTHDNKKNKQPFSSNNDYAVLSVRSDNNKGFGKSNLAQPDDVYDSAEGGKHKTMSHQSNDYAVFNSNNGDKHGNDKANTLYETATDKKMRPGNNDYDFCELDTD